MAPTHGEPLIRLGDALASGDGLVSPNVGGGHQPSVEIPLSAFRRHVCILGKSGAGKSVTGMILARQLSQHCSVLVLDRTGEFASSLGRLPGTTVYTPGSNLTVSPFASDKPASSAGASDDVERAVSLMEHYLQVSIGTGLTPLQARVFREALGYCLESLTPKAGISQVIGTLRAMQMRLRGMKGWAESVEAVISRLHPFSVGRLAGVFDADSPSLDAKRLFEPGLHIIDLDPLDTDEAKNLLSQMVASQVSGHGRRMGITQELRFVLVVDEAHHISPNQRNYLSVLERYALELRKYGMGLVVIATRPTLISENILANCNTVVCHQLTGSKDIDLALNYMVNRLEEERFLSEFRLLDVGDGLVQLNDPERSANPIKFRVTVPGEVVLVPSSKEAARSEAGPGGGAPKERAPVLPPKDDAAWTVYSVLPPWAREAVKLASLTGNQISIELLQEIVSKSQAKEMTHGPHRLFTQNGPTFTLTHLGAQVAAIQRSSPKDTPLPGKKDEGVRDSLNS
ncbi:MAG TPA: ATP-binding protein [Nitrososphaerales archaeon]|nr:ATP-binding protein [Nitrososphaerales archaeon]